METVTEASIAGAKPSILEGRRNVLPEALQE